ncbi:MAG: SUMF1/EgtB/PvdO family nonheme iron enzyme [Verrucomicrobia bacterium]|nr:SUMF1/EgtB/PvdO family nonheme iron enzyme [Verrucomicrobiota bacterium]
MSLLRSGLFRSLAWGVVSFGLLAASRAGEPGRSGDTVGDARFDLPGLRLAIEDLAATFGDRYPRRDEFLAELAALEAILATRPRPLDPARESALAARVDHLRRTALLANPLLDFDRLLFVRRRAETLSDYRRGQAMLHEIGMPCNHWSNSSLPRDGYENQLAVLSPVRPDGRVTLLHQPSAGGYVGEMDLHSDGARVLFAQSDATNWKIFEIGVDGSGLRQVSRMPDDVDAYDPCYLPDGRIIFGSTASFQAVPCWSGIPHRVANLYRMDADGKNVRQLCFDQDHDLYPTVRGDGQVMYSRWDYTGIRHEYLRLQMTMNPDGTGQRALYGTNSWWPNAIYFARPIPGNPDRMVAIIGDYHGVPRMGWLAIFDTSRGWQDADGVVQLIPGRDRKVVPVIKEKLVTGTWPLFLHPWPLSEKHFLVACRPAPERGWGLYLADVFDNLVLLREEPGWALLEPVPVRSIPRPPVIPDRIDPSAGDATVYVHDVYTGKAMEGVPRGTVKALRLFAYDFGYPGLAGSTRVGIGGPWEVNRILGTTPVEADGSAFFRVPANTPLSLQPVDAEGRAVQLMRSWYTAMPGEKVSCIGCHESNRELPRGPSAGPPGSQAGIVSRALQRGPVDLTPWFGPPRGFDFEREVQPVLDRYCVECHQGAPRPDGLQPPDLRARARQPDYRGFPVALGDSTLARPEEDVRRLEACIDRQGVHRDLPYGRLRFSPAYDVLFRLVRRPSVEDDVDLPRPGEFLADTSRLVQMLKRGHHGVVLDAESWSRIYTWIDLNAPCHGTWGEVYAIPGNVHQRRLELRAQYGGPTTDYELEPRRLPPVVLAAPPPPPKNPKTASAANRKRAANPAARANPLPDWTLTADEARRRQAADGPAERLVDLGGGVSLKLVRVPAGSAVVTDGGTFPFAPRAPVTFNRGFWMSACEITNRQYQAFDPNHDSGYARDFRRRLPVTERQSRPLNEPDQPVVRVSWHQAVAFCAWLGARTGLQVALPSEAQWEYACRAGTDTPFPFGALNAEFSRHANLADQNLPGLGTSLINDGAIVTVAVGRYLPNAWGLFDMHGNVAEWTSGETSAGKVVRGGSFYDLPADASATARYAYPAWRQLHDVGFRVICEPVNAAAVAATPPVAR